MPLQPIRNASDLARVVTDRLYPGSPAILSSLNSSSSDRRAIVFESLVDEDGNPIAISGGTIVGGGDVVG